MGENICKSYRNWYPKYIKNSQTSVITWQPTKLKSGQRETSGFSFNTEKGSHRANRHLKSGDKGILRITAEISLAEISRSRRC